MIKCSMYRDGKSPYNHPLMELRYHRGSGNGFPTGSVRVPGFILRL